eukprot:CAMPEP_0119059278 /NCGR_PEP_ID=MMETSP1178-20130426/3466_1 /TAXON_ID=33656 /ORGANISM="unid sp, Strain CCMP2000" /LENGTH=88 /DNA_ID=CAMNT_0007040297 /DNA_START=1144 /DNA_END=1407 /DNA_ORIENTATION=-
MFIGSRSESADQGTTVDRRVSPVSSTGDGQRDGGGPDERVAGRVSTAAVVRTAIWFMSSAMRRKIPAGFAPFGWPSIMRIRRTESGGD